MDEEKIKLFSQVDMPDGGFCCGCEKFDEERQDCLLINQGLDWRWSSGKCRKIPECLEAMEQNKKPDNRTQGTRI